MDELKTKFMSEGLDWELVSYMEPAYRSFEERLVTSFAAQNEFILSVSSKITSSDRKTLALACRKVADEMNQNWLFGYGMNYFTSKFDEAILCFDAHLLDVTTAQMKQIRKTWTEA